MRMIPVLHKLGLGSVSVDKDHIWAFFGSAYMAVNVTVARVECNPDRKDPTSIWMGIVFEEQLAYNLGKGQQRTMLRRASQREPALLSYQESVGSLGPA